MNNYNNTNNSGNYFTSSSGSFDFTTSTGASNYFTCTTGTNYSITPDKDWMPYEYVEYTPTWHKQYARYKIQMESMWK